MHGYTKAIPIDIDPNLTLDSDQLVPSQKAVKAYADTVLQTANNTATFNLANSLAFIRREVLSSPRTYYVRTDGNDFNSGLADSPAGAFLTIQPAIDIISNKLDLGGQAVVIQVGAGTYTGGVSFASPWVGGVDVSLIGDAITPSNVTISRTTGFCISVNNGVTVKISGFTLTNSGGGGLSASNNSFVTVSGPMVYGAVTTAQILSQGRSSVALASDYTITGGGAYHWQSNFSSYGGRGGNRTITLTGIPSFSTAFASATQGGSLNVTGYTWVGTATGKRYDVTLNATISTGGVTLPGSVAGTATTGGQYS